MEVVSLLTCIPPLTMNLFPLVSIKKIVFCFFLKITNMHIILVPSSPSHNQAGSYKIEAIWVHSETVTYRDTVTGRERKIENEETNLKIYI